MKRLKVAAVLGGQPVGETVDVRGWVRTKRESKQGFAFVELNDGSSFANLQLVVEQTVPGYAEFIKQLGTGASLRAVGEVKASPAKGQAVEVAVRELEVYGTADPESYPLQKKQTSFEFLREIAHLRWRTNTFGAMARVRNALCAAIHNFFQARGFLYIHTPVITTSDCEGAADVSGHHAGFGAIGREVTRSGWDRLHAGLLRQAGFADGERATRRGDRRLRRGGHLHLRPTFRAENSNTTRHLSEFWMVEPRCRFTTSKTTCGWPKSSSARSSPKSLTSARATWSFSASGSSRRSSTRCGISSTTTSSG